MSTIDKVAAIILIGAVGIGLLSMFIGWLINLMFPTAEEASAQTVQEPVHVPVRESGSNRRTDLEEHDITEGWEPPRLGRRLSDDELLCLLAVQKGVDGAKYRFTANKLCDLMGGTRSQVLDRIREIRGGPPAPHVRDLQRQLEELQEEAA